MLYLDIPNNVIMNIIKWVVGVLFLLVALESVGHGGLGLVAGVLFLMAGLVCIPPISNKIWDQIGFEITRPIKYFVVIFFWLAAAFVYSKIEKGNLKLESTKNETEILKIEPNSNNKLKLDSTIDAIKKDKDNKVQSIEVLPDSTLKIIITNVKDGITAIGVDNIYDVLKIGNIQEIEVYYKGVLSSTYGKKTSKSYDEFSKEFVSSYDGSCRPVEYAIKESMNDPDSYKHKSTYVAILVDGRFEITTIFHGKNAFGGTIMNKAKAIVSKNGDVLSLKMID